MRPVLGEFLAAASEHVDALTTTHPDLPEEAVPAVVRDLARLTAVMARCANAFAVDDHDDSCYQLDARALALLDARAALGHAATRMHIAAGAVDHCDDQAHHPAAARLAAAISYLSASHDLLQSHFAPAPAGARLGNSPWAPAIVSVPVSVALAAQMGSYAGRLAPWIHQLAAQPPKKTLPAGTRTALSAACRWLRIAEAAAWAASDRRSTVAHAVLRGIPANTPPPRLSPRGDELVPGLCAGMVATAERLRHLAYLSATRAGSLRTGMAACWQRTAQGAAIAAHCSELILRQLDSPTAQLPIPPAASRALQEAAEETSRMWRAWRTVAHHWDNFTTGPGITLSPIAAEIGDLVLWAGRIAYADPVWTPSRHHASTTRTGTGFTVHEGLLAEVVAALHQTGDTLAHIAATDREHVRSAAFDKELWIPTRLLPAKADWPYRYMPALPAMTDELLAAYDAAAHAAQRAVTSLGDLPLSLNPQPTLIAALRATAQPTRSEFPYPQVIPVGPPATHLRPGRIEQSLRSQGVSEPTLLARATDIDDATEDLISAVTAPSQRHAAINRATLRALDGSKYPQRASHLAAQDSPPTTASRHPLPRLVPINHQIRHRPVIRRRQTP
jgi:hypothetical protein